MSAPPLQSMHASALHPSEITATVDAHGQPILMTGPMTPSIDFNPDEFRSSAQPFAGEGSASHLNQHSNPHPVVAKSGIDLSSGVQRPAETHANSGVFSDSSSTGLNSGSSGLTGGSGLNSGSSGLTGGSSANSGSSGLTGGSGVNSGSSGLNGQSTSNTGSAQPTVTGLRQRAGSITNTVGAKVNAVGNNVGAQLNSVGNTVGQQLNQASATVGQGLQQAAEHPAVQNAKQTALKQADSFRETLGRYPIVVNAEKQTGIDRVALVVGGVFLYLLLIPLNLFGLALPTTQLLTFLPPTFLALRTLDAPNEERTKTLLSYFVVFGFVQFAESLMAGFLERKIPQYYTVKLLFLAYLIHPKTKGARKIHSSVLRPLLIRAQQAQQSGPSATTPPTTKASSGATVNSPSFPSSDVPLARTSGFATTGSSQTQNFQGGQPVVFVPVSAEGLNNDGRAQAASQIGQMGHMGQMGQGQGQGQTGQIHLPSGSGTGVGQEVPNY